MIDPYPAGSGHVWQPGQSRLYLMNTQSFYPTLIPEDPALAPPVAGTTFNRWRARQQQHPCPSLTDDERAELAALGSRRTSPAAPCTAATCAAPSRNC